MSISILAGDMPNCVFNLEATNLKAQNIISSYAKMHAAMDVGIGIAGLLPIPGAATVALLGAIAAQAPVVYNPMTKELARLYCSSPDSSTDLIQKEALVIGAIADVGIEFLREIATELISESFAGLALTAIPFIGGFLAAGLDATIAATLTWRVGTMVTAYYQNGGAWIGSRKHTYEIASRAVEGFTPEPTNRADLNRFARETPQISEKHIMFVVTMVDMMKTAIANKDQIRAALSSKQIPSWIIEKAIQRAFA